MGPGLGVLIERSPLVTLEARGRGQLALYAPYGTLFRVNLAAGEEYTVDPRYLVAWSIPDASSGINNSGPQPLQQVLLVLVVASGPIVRGQLRQGAHRLRQAARRLAPREGPQRCCKHAERALECWDLWA